MDDVKYQQILAEAQKWAEAWPDKLNYDWLYAQLGMARGRRVNQTARAYHDRLWEDLNRQHPAPEPPQAKSRRPRRSRYLPNLLPFHPSAIWVAAMACCRKWRAVVLRNLRSSSDKLAFLAMLRTLWPRMWHLAGQVRLLLPSSKAGRV